MFMRSVIDNYKLEQSDSDNAPTASSLALLVQSGIDDLEALRRARAVRKTIEIEKSICLRNSQQSAVLSHFERDQSIRSGNYSRRVYRDGSSTDGQTHN